MIRNKFLIGFQLLRMNNPKSVDESLSTRLPVSEADSLEQTQDIIPTSTSISSLHNVVYLNTPRHPLGEDVTYMTEKSIVSPSALDSPYDESNRPSSFSRLLALVYRTTLIKRRQRISTALEIIFPLIFVLLLIFPRRSDPLV